MKNVATLSFRNPFSLIDDEYLISNTGNTVPFYMIIIFVVYIFLSAFKEYLIDYFYVSVILLVILTFRIPFVIKRNKSSTIKVRISKSLNFILCFIVSYSIYLVLNLNDGFSGYVLLKILDLLNPLSDKSIMLGMLINAILPTIFLPITFLIDVIIIPILGLPFIQIILWSTVPYFINIEEKVSKTKVISNNDSRLKLIVRCPKCEQKHFVPSNKGKILVTCAQCSQNFKCNTNISRNKKYRRNSYEIETLEKKLKRAQNYVQDDASSALMQLRAFCEDIVNCVLTYENLSTYKDLDQIDKIKGLENEGIIDRGLTQKFHFIRKLGNAAVHNSHDSKVDASNALEQAQQIYSWFQNRYIG